MAQVGTVSIAPFKNFFQGNQAIKARDEQQKQRDQQQHHQHDRRFHIPDDEDAYQVDEYV